VSAPRGMTGLSTFSGNGSHVTRGRSTALVIVGGSKGVKVLRGRRVTIGLVWGSKGSLSWDPTNGRERSNMERNKSSCSACASSLSKSSG
jgi:hypothetical protein